MLTEILVEEKDSRKDRNMENEVADYARHCLFQYKKKIFPLQKLWDFQKKKMKSPSFEDIVVQIIWHMQSEFKKEKVKKIRIISSCRQNFSVCRFFSFILKTDSPLPLLLYNNHYVMLLRQLDKLEPTQCSTHRNNLGLRIINQNYVMIEAFQVWHKGLEFGRKGEVNWIDHKKIKVKVCWQDLTSVQKGT